MWFGRWFVGFVDGLGVGLVLLSFLLFYLVLLLFCLVICVCRWWDFVFCFCLVDLGVVLLVCGFVVWGLGFVGLGGLWVCFGCCVGFILRFCGLGGVGII